MWKSEQTENETCFFDRHRRFNISTKYNMKLIYSKSLDIATLPVHEPTDNENSRDCFLTF